MVLTIFAMILVLVFLLILDFQLGKRVYQKNPPRFPFPHVQADYRLFTTGEALFSSLFKDLQQATNKIDIMFFIVRNDGLSRQLYSILKQKANEGVRIRLLVDQIGGLFLKKKIIQDLEDHGVQFVYSNKPSLPYYFYKLNRRNHRKITIIDETIGYVGGFNIGKEYIGRDPKLGPWRDYHLKVTGEIVSQLMQVFQYDWNSAIMGRRAESPAPEIEEDKGSQSSSPNTQLVVTECGQLEDKFVTWIDNAKSEILIGTPYFIPSKPIFQALLQALSRGVEIKLIVPMKADHPFVRPAAFPYLQQFHRAGGKIYLFDNGFYHTKVMIIDQAFCDVGTANFDIRSIFLNKEINTIIETDTSFIHDIRTSVLKDIKQSLPFSEEWIRQQPLTTKISGLLARCLRPLL